jgi:regulatory protein
VKITNIKQQVKRSDRYSIYVDGKYCFSFGETELLNSGLHINRELSGEELEGLKDTAAADKAYDRALNYISLRRRSEWEIRDYLKRKDSPPTLVNLIVNKLSISGYVDDVKFAEAWVRNRRLLKATSQRRLSQELHAKRVNDEIVRQVLAKDETDETEVLTELIAKKRKQTKYQDNLKLMQYLARQGYNYDDIKSALKAEVED